MVIESSNMSSNKCLEQKCQNKGVIMPCRNCKQAGHSKKNCHNPAIVEVRALNSVCHFLSVLDSEFCFVFLFFVLKLSLCFQFRQPKKIGTPVKNSPAEAIVQRKGRSQRQQLRESTQPSQTSTQTSQACITYV